MANSRALEITSRIGCVNMCQFCPQELLIGRYSKLPKETRKIILDFETYKKSLRTVPKDVRIDFSGMAEPWLNKNCTEMVLYAYSHGFKRITIFTTTVGMTVADVQKIKHIPFEFFCLHLADKEGYSKIKVTNQYLKVLKEIKNANISNLNFMALGKLHPKLKPLFNGLLESPPLVSRAGNLPSFPKINKTGPITCCRPERLQHNVLLPNGDVLFCGDDYGMTQILGNLLRESYEDIFKNKPFENILRLLKSEKNGDIICRHCEHAVYDPAAAGLIRSHFRAFKKSFLNLIS